MDPVYRASLSPEQLKNLPPHPSGINSSERDALEHAMGGDEFTFGSGCGSAGCFSFCYTESCTQGCTSVENCPTQNYTCPTYTTCPTSIFDTACPTPQGLCDTPEC